MRSIAVLGGTFDPVHFGHLRPALELAQLGFDEVRLMPCYIPVHRGVPRCSAEQRLAMLALAVESEPQLVIDRREFDCKGKSFTVDSLVDMRNELGGDVCLSLVMGMDAFLGFSGWREWGRIIQLANIIVVQRPGSVLSTTGFVGAFLDAHCVHSIEALSSLSSGGVLIQQLTSFDISATSIRSLISRGASVRYLLPETVCNYINRHQLYATVSS